VLPKMADHWLADEYTPQRTPYVEHEFTRSYVVGNNRAGHVLSYGSEKYSSVLSSGVIARARTIPRNRAATGVVGSDCS
jgi:peroxiredoxin